MAPVGAAACCHSGQNRPRSGASGDAGGVAIRLLSGQGVGWREEPDKASSGTSAYEGEGTEEKMKYFFLITSGM